MYYTVELSIYFMIADSKCNVYFRLLPNSLLRADADQQHSARKVRGGDYESCFRSRFLYYEALHMGMVQHAEHAEHAEMHRDLTCVHTHFTV